jgi:hypothetical protein
MSWVTIIWAMIASACFTLALMLGGRKLLQAENLRGGSFVLFTIHDPQSTESPCKLISQNRLKA